MSRALTLCASVIAACSGCTPSCPDPSMPNPATATWSSMRAVATEAGGTVAATTIVVRWSALPRDPLPDSYYANIEAFGGTDAGSMVESIKLSAPHQVSIELRDLDAYLKSSTQLELSLALTDPRGSIHCSHPGRADEFDTRVTLQFDPASHAVSARFGEMHAHRGACDVGAGAGSGRQMMALVSLLLAAGVLARRRTRGAL